MEINYYSTLVFGFLLSEDEVDKLLGTVYKDGGEQYDYLDSDEICLSNNLEEYPVEFYSFGFLDNINYIVYCKNGIIEVDINEPFILNLSKIKTPNQSEIIKLHTWCADNKIVYQKPGWYLTGSWR